MKKRANLVAALAFFVGLGSFQLYASRLRAEASGGPLKGTLVVTKDLEAGSVLSDEDLGVAQIPADYLDPRRILAAERANLLGVEIEKKIRAGEGLVWSDLADGAAHKHLAALIAPGNRAYSLESDTNPLGRLLRVADHVDVLLEAGGQTSTLLQHVLVLAVGGQIERQEEPLGPSSSRGSGVTLSVSAHEAHLLLSAETRGQLRLVLRNPTDQRLERETANNVSHPAPQTALVDPHHRAEAIEHVH